MRYTITSALFIILLAMLFSTLILHKADATVKKWCVAYEQTPPLKLQVALDWACGGGGANCSKIQVNQPCFLPDTLKAHASYAFNDYYQKYKHKGGGCYFNSAAMLTEHDPSHNSCKFEYLP